MRPAPWVKLERFRCSIPGWASSGGDDFGAFSIPIANTTLWVLASAGDKDMRWEHVSVSLSHRCPTWDEMVFVKDLFWLPTETVMQLHVPEADHRNLHPYCLHLWRPTDIEIPRPPGSAVAPDALVGRKGA